MIEVSSKTRYGFVIWLLDNVKLTKTEKESKNENFDLFENESRGYVKKIIINI